MRISRYLDAKAFLDEAKALKVVSSQITDAVLERLEKQRSLLPHLRLHYPDPIKRRCWAQAHQGYEVGGVHGPNGVQWDDARALEEARQRRRWEMAPSVVAHPLDNPKERFRQFMERPVEQPFVPWQDYRVAVNADGAEPLYAAQTVVT